MGFSRRRRRLLGPARAAVVALAVIVVTAGPAPASAEFTVEPRGVALSKSASCSQGDIEITYAARGVERQVTDFTAEDGRVLQHYDLEVYSPIHDGTEYILSQNRQPPPARSIVAVHVSIGTSPPNARSGEFFLAYRCDTRSNAEGGRNEVTSTCVGLLGTCPVTAAAAAIRPAAPASATPAGQLSFTGARVAPLAQVALAALLLGTLLFAVSKRRSARRS